MKAEPSEAVTADLPKAPDAPTVSRPPLPPTPLTWRLGLAAVIVVVALAAYVAQPVIGTRGQAVAGVFCFFALVAAFSTSLQSVKWRTIGWGVGLQLLLAVMVLQ